MEQCRMGNIVIILVRSVNCLVQFEWLIEKLIMLNY